MKTKYIVLLLITFIAGFFIGSLTTGRVTRTKVEKIKFMNTPEGFRENMYRILQATPEQKQALTPVLDSFSKIHWQLMLKSWEEQNNMFMQLDESIRPHVSEEQYHMLMQHKQKMMQGRTPSDTNLNKEEEPDP
ncbi:MAG: hypothetical protein M0Q41_06835 [Bacteroidales bacterium]|nr:hypothetical protein [Bacteroidales bacterium]